MILRSQCSSAHRETRSLAGTRAGQPDVEGRAKGTLGLLQLKPQPLSAGSVSDLGDAELPGVHNLSGQAATRPQSALHSGSLSTSWARGHGRPAGSC